MFRVLGALVALSVFALQSQTGAFHTHAPLDGTEDPHHHGPAIHHHDYEDVTGAPHMDEPESASSIVRVAVPTAIVGGTAAFFVVTAEVLPSPVLRCVGRAPTVVTHSHDPPITVQPPLRGPPHALTA